MTYVLRIIIASAAALLVSGLALTYGPLEIVAHWGGIMLFTYLGVICVVLPGLTWWAAMRLMRML